MIGYVNLYMYDTGRLHVGTGIYSTEEQAKDIAKKKKRYIGTRAINNVEDLGVRPSACGGGFLKA